MSPRARHILSATRKPNAPSNEGKKKEVTSTMSKNKEKTNVMRLLDQKKVAYQAYAFEADSSFTGEDVAHALNKDVATVFKTLVTESKSKNHYVFVIPVDKELDLKKASAAAQEKSVAMLKAKDLLPLTGYVHGGCSPIGMKKPFQTFIHESIRELDTITFSAGKIGFQVELQVDDLPQAFTFSVADLIQN